MYWALLQHSCSRSLPSSFTLPSAFLPITPFHISSSLPTCALKSPKPIVDSWGITNSFHEFRVQCTSVWGVYLYQNQTNGPRTSTSNYTPFLVVKSIQHNLFYEKNVFLSDNLVPRNIKNAIKDSKNSVIDWNPKKTWVKNGWSGWRPDSGDHGQKCKTYPDYDIAHDSKSKTVHFFNRNEKTFRIFRGFEQFSRAWRVMAFNTTVRGPNTLRNVTVSVYVTFYKIRNFSSIYYFFIIDKMSLWQNEIASRIGLNDFAGWIWPADCSFEPLG